MTIWNLKQVGDKGEGEMAITSSSFPFELDIYLIWKQNCSLKAGTKPQLPKIWKEIRAIHSFTKDLLSAWSGPDTVLCLSVCLSLLEYYNGQYKHVKIVHVKKWKRKSGVNINGPGTIYTVWLTLLSDLLSLVVFTQFHKRET